MEERALLNLEVLRDGRLNPARSNAKRSQKDAQSTNHPILVASKKTDVKAFKRIEDGKSHNPKQGM